MTWHGMAWHGMACHVMHHQVTITPATATEAADQAVILREVVRSTAERFGQKASFTPLTMPGGVGNGVHIHLSLWDANTNETLTYDNDGPHGVSKTALQFSAGVLRALPDIVAITAPSVLSYQRLIPQRWSAPFNNLGFRDREASLRICPGDARNGKDPAKGTNLEFRACDATGNPHLVLGAIINAGMQGIREELPAPMVTHEDLSVLDAPGLSKLGVERLPQSLSEALDRLEANERAREILTGDLLEVYLSHKRHEVEIMEGLDAAEVCKKYMEAY